jgi:putative DNA primase/helicase
MSCEETFRNALRQSGIEYSGPFLIDGKLHRIKAGGDHSKNSWYVLYPGSPVAGAFGCWKRDIKETWCERNGNLTREERQNVRQRWQEATSKLKAETLTRQKKARKIAAWFLDRSRRAVTMHPYLYRKRVKVFGNLREYCRRLVVPLRDSGGELHSLQFIDKDGTKNFLTGGRIAGCFFVLADKAEGPLVICEGYATGASIYEATGHAVICAMNSGNLLEVAKAVRTVWPQREIIVAADNDQFTDGNPGLTKATAAAKAIGAKLAVPPFDALVNKPTDFNDLAILQGLDAVGQQIGSAKVPGEIESENAPQTGENTDEETLQRLAALSTLEYERVREAEAEKLGCRVAILDHLLRAKRLLMRPPSDGEALQGTAVKLADVEPWPEPVNGAEILDQVASRFEHYVVLPQGAADTLGLWCTHTHVYKLFQKSPRLDISAPAQECGKTTLRNCASLFCAREVRTDNMTTAVMFRLVSGHSPTILADECDKWLFINEELVGLVCSGHEKGGAVMRCEGDSNELRKFGCYAPFVLAAIGALPSQLHSRSICIRLERAKREEIKKRSRFDLEHVEYETELNRKLARWTADKRERIASCDPTLPEHLFNRIADNWRPLFTIAEVAGGDWPQRCADALVKLTTREDETESLRVMLLADIKQVFTGERMFSKDLVEQLVELKERPWPEICRGKPITARWLASTLAHFRIHSGNIWDGEKQEQAKGYERTQFNDVFARYVPETPEGGNSSVQPSNTEVKPENSIRPKEKVWTDEKRPIHEAIGRLDGSKGGKPGKADKVDTFLPAEQSTGKEKLRL